MKTLFVDTSRKSLSIALADDDKLLFVSNVESHSKHSNYLLNEIKNILTMNNININEIDNYVVLNGPGSFTGVRVGITVCKTLAWTLSKKLYVINNLEALHLHAKNDIVIAIIPDKKETAYVGIYDDKKMEDYLNIYDSRLDIYNKNITIINMEENDFSKSLLEKLESQNNNVKLLKIEDYDYQLLINNVLKLENINPHLAKPLYMKKIDAEK